MVLELVLARRVQQGSILEEDRHLAPPVLLVFFRRRVRARAQFAVEEQSLI